MRLLDNPIRRYAWGSRTAIALLCGRPAPAEEPEAELWIGAHPDDPSRVDGVGLDKRIAAAPVDLLGAPAAARFGARLPYLLKYLAAAAPLSIQVHPDVARAREGFARHAYTDPYHKPELLVARTRFEALCGLRDPGEVATELAGLRVAAFGGVVAALGAGDAHAALATALALPRATCREALTGAVARRDALPAAQADLLARLATGHPDDPGVLVAMMLRRYVLEPGEAIFVAPGQLHSYVRGVGVEIMASSDNVVRGGLTPKHVDVPELLALASTEPAGDARLPGVPESPTVTLWSPPVDDFRLRLVRHTGAAETALVPDGPRAVFCVSGELDVRDSVDMVRLRSGEAAFGAAGGGEIRLRGTGEAFVASL